MPTKTFDLSLRLRTASASRSLKTLGTNAGKAGTGVDKVSKSADRASKSGDRVSKSHDRASRSTKRFDLSSQGLWKRLRRGVIALSAVTLGLLGVSSALGVLTQSVQAKTAIEAIDRSLLAATGTAEAGRREFAFVREEVDRLGLSLQDAGRDFSQLAAAAKDTKIEGQGTRDIFTAVGETMTVLGRSADDTRGAMRALVQVISKGTVQAEELRGQIGERIPGAFQIMARALGVTTIGLNKMLELGQVLAEDALPKFARELRKTFSAGLADAMTSTRASLNRFSTAVFETKALIGEGLAPVVADIATDLARWLKQNDELVISLGQNVGGAVQTLAGVVGFLVENVVLLTAAFVSLLALNVARWAATTTVGMRLLTVGTLDLGLAIRGVRAGYLSLFSVGVGAKIAAWLAPLKAAGALVATMTVGWALLAAAAASATNVGVSAWADTSAAAIKRATSEANEFTAGLDEIGRTSELAAATGNLDKMTDARGSDIYRF